MKELFSSEEINFLKSFGGSYLSRNLLYMIQSLADSGYCGTSKSIKNYKNFAQLISKNIFNLDNLKSEIKKLNTSIAIQESNLSILESTKRDLKEYLFIYTDKTNLQKLVDLFIRWIMKGTKENMKLEHWYHMKLDWFYL